MPFNETLYQELKPGQPMVVPKEEFARRFSPLTAKEQKELDLGNRPKRKEAKEQGKVSYQEAKDILGEDFLGPEAAEKTWGFRPETIPIPFTREELIRAKELNQFLQLRVDRIMDTSGNYAPLTMQNADKILGPKFLAANKGKVLFNATDEWKLNSDFFTKETPQVRWALVSKDVIPNSTKKNHLQQTEVIVEYIKNQIFQGQQIPREYQEAIDEFEAQKATIADLIKTDWKAAALALENLKINQMTRQTPVEAAADTVTYFDNNGKRLLQTKYTWTARRSSDGRLVSFGCADAEGATLYRWKPVNASDYLGVVLSRSL